MKLKVVASVAMLALFATFAQANVVFTSNSGQDICSKIPGKWKGDGKVSALGGILKCNYHSDDANVELISMSGKDSSVFSLHITLTTKDVCPNETIDLKGTCDNGNIVLQTDSAHLVASLSSDGTDINNAHGTVKFSVPVIGNVVANVTDMNLHKK